MVWHFHLPNLWERKFLLLKLLGLWYMAVPARECRPRQGGSVHRSNLRESGDSITKKKGSEDAGGCLESPPVSFVCQMGHITPAFPAPGPCDVGVLSRGRWQLIQSPDPISLHFIVCVYKHSSEKGSVGFTRLWSSVRGLLSPSYVTGRPCACALPTPSLTW